MDWANRIRDVLHTFRSFWTSDIPVNRKRRAIAEPSCDIMDLTSEMYSHSPKRRHMLSSPREVVVLDAEDPFLKSTLISNRRSPRNQNRPMETIILDSEDIVPVKKGNETRFEVRNRSTEKKGILTQQNGGNHRRFIDDDVIIVNDTKGSPRERDATWLSKWRGTKQRPSFEVVDRQFPIKPSLHYSIRMDDKLQYKRLLEHSSASENSYHTPTGKFLEYDTANRSRAERIVNIARSTPVVTRSSLSTKDTIKKVLNNFENDSIVIKDSEDSDSDVVFVNPPSPKPDIRVEPVNSLEKVVDQSEETKHDWLDDKVKKHRCIIEARQAEIDKLRESAKFHQQNNDQMRLDLLSQRIDRALRLKDVILPEIEKEPELPELTPDHLKLLEKAFKGYPDKVLVKKFNLNITRRDLNTLEGLNWLNDEVINFYMNLIIERGKDSRWPKVYAFNTFFYLKLCREGPESLRRWTKRIDLFQYDIICIPIHLTMHWCMAIIDLRHKTIKYYNSMEGGNNKCLQLLRSYLEAEHMDKKKTPLDTSEFQLINVRDIPQQMNGSDCGMFSCTFAEYAARDAKVTFSQEDMPYFRRKMAVEILTGELLIK